MDCLLLGCMSPWLLRKTNCGFEFHLFRDGGDTSEVQSGETEENVFLTAQLSTAAPNAESGLGLRYQFSSSWFKASSSWDSVALT